MLTSLHQKVSSLVHRHREPVEVEVEVAVEPVQDLTTAVSTSKNWDFTIIFKGAKDIPRGDILSSDPYLEAYLGSPKDPQSLAFVTGVQWSTLSPTWNAKWELVNVPEDAVLQIFIKDKDKIKEDTPLGENSLVLGSKFEGTQEHVLDIIRADGKTQGQILVQTTGTRTHGKAALLLKPSTKGPVNFSRHTSYAAGVLTREKKYEFYTYRLRLYHLLDVFGTDTFLYQHWNTNYDAAKKIFGDNLEGLNIRNALHSQHSYLYRHGRNTLYDQLVTANEFGMLLHGDRLKNDPNQDLKAIVFTYSIVPKGVYFSETGAAFFQDFMSKHAMHANRATEVMFSGEFRFFKDENHHNDWTLLIDNNSGTYSPKKEDLFKVKKIFELNFPDLVVIALDHEDLYLKEIRAETKRLEAELASKQKQRFSLFSNLSSKNDDSTLEV